MNATALPKRHSGLSLLGLFEVVCVMGLLATVAGFFARLWWMLELTTHFRPHLVVTLLALAGFGTWRRRWRWVVACGGGSLLNALLILPHFFAGPVAPTSGGTLKIVSLNVHASNPQPDLVLAFLHKANADIVLLMEVDDAWMQNSRLGPGNIRINSSRPARTISASRCSVACLGRTRQSRNWVRLAFPVSLQT